MDHTINETNHLTLKYELNGTSCNSNTSVNVQLKDENCSENCTIEQFSIKSPYTFDNPLQPCHNYKYTYFLLGQFYSNNLTAHYMYTNVTNLKAVDIKAGTAENPSMLNISVTWDYEYAVCDQQFVVKISSDNAGESFITNAHNYMIGNVTACSQYDIKVYPQVADQDIESFGQEISINTNRVDPSPILNFEVSSRDNAIEVGWIAPIYGRKCIVSYGIFVESEFESIVESNVSCCKQYITVQYSCVNYTVTLKTFSNDPAETTTLLPETTTSMVIAPEINSYANSKSEQAEIRSIQTKALNLSAAEISPTQSALQTDTELYLNVEVNTTRNKCNITKYAFKCTSSINGNSSFDESLQPNVILQNLIPDTDYSCSTKVENEAGWSDYVFPTIFKTKQGSKQAFF
jgi:hypothetical protein